MNLLTKSKYLIGLQCPKYLWIAVHQKDKIPEPDKQTLQIMEEGTKVGELATKLFKNGINLANLDYQENLKQTKESIKLNKPIFEAGFQINNLFSRADILNPIKDSWEIIEVKSGTKVKEINIQDVAFQKHICEKQGLKISKCFLLHLNKEYIKKENLNINQLFIKEDITAKVNEIKNIKNKIKEMFNILEQNTPPDTKIHHNCNHPYPCPLEECKNFLPEHNVLHLYRIGKKAFELLENDIHHIKDIPDGYKLNDKQNIQLKCAKTGKPNINKEGIKHFLNTLVYPLYFLDFETFSTAIPLFDGLKPYSQVPFQFSLHIVDKAGKTVHHQFLYSGDSDPREEFLENLKKVLGSKGSIVVYNQSFEISRLKELAISFPEYESWVSGVLTRVVDLLIPFRNFSYYNPKQKGSASIKYVLPAICGKSYEGLEIADGGAASLEFFNMAYKNGKDVRKALLKYCGLDTEAMVLIMQELRRLI